MCFHGDNNQKWPPHLHSTDIWMKLNGCPCIPSSDLSVTSLREGTKKTVFGWKRSENTASPSSMIIMKSWLELITQTFSTGFGKQLLQYGLHPLSQTCVSGFCWVSPFSVVENLLVKCVKLSHATKASRRRLQSNVAIDERNQPCYNFCGIS